jgi:hypothetical protein
VRGEGADACLSSDQLTVRVARRLGFNPFTPNGGLWIEGTVERVSGSYKARIFARTGGQVGKRELSSNAEDCRPLEEAAVLAIALVIDPDAALAPPAETASTQGVQEPAPVAPPSQEAPRGVVEPPSFALGSVSAGPLVALNILPRATLGASVTAGVAMTQWFSVQLGGVFLSESRSDDFGFGLTAGRVSGCLNSAPGRWSATACTSALTGAIYAVPYRLDPVEPGARFWLSTSLSAAGELRLAGPVYASVGIEGLLTPVRPRFSLEGSGQTVFNVPLLGAMAHADLDVLFR